MRQPRPVGYSVSAVAVLVLAVIALAAYAAPLVTIEKPRNLEVISGTADIHVSYAADSASPIERVQVFIDGHLVKDYRLEKPQMQGRVTFRWDFSIETPSSHSISARAQDTSGAVGATGIKVEIRRAGEPARAAAVSGPDRTPPTVDIYYPAEGQVVKGELRVKADVSDNVGVRTVVFFLDGEFKTIMMNSPNYSDKIDTTRLADGPHVVRVSAYDAADNEGRAERTFIVQNQEAAGTKAKSGESRIAVTPQIVPDVRTIPSPAVPELPAPAADQTGAGAPAGETIAKAIESARELEGTPVAGSPQDVPKTAPKELTPPPSVVHSDVTSTPKARPTTSGPTGALPAPAEVRTAMLAAPSEWEWAARPRAAAAGTPKTVVPPVVGEMVVWSGVGREEVARSQSPADAPWQPRSATVVGQPTIVLAAPAAEYEEDPAGQPQPGRVAMLPPQREGQLKTKAALPGVDPQQMARFRDVKIVFDGKLIPLRSAPEVINGISIAPLREVFESCDGTLYWFHEEKRVHAVSRSVEMELKIGRDKAKVNGEVQDLVLAPYIKNGRTMVPLEFLANTLDVTVSFNSTTGELIISRNGF